MMLSKISLADLIIQGGLPQMSESKVDFSRGYRSAEITVVDQGHGRFSSVSQVGLIWRVK